MDDEVKPKHVRFGASKSHIFFSIWVKTEHYWVVYWKGHFSCRPYSLSPIKIVITHERLVPIWKERKSNKCKMLSCVIKFWREYSDKYNTLKHARGPYIPAFVPVSLAKLQHFTFYLHIPQNISTEHFHLHFMFGRSSISTRSFVSIITILTYNCVHTLLLSSSFIKH